MNRRLTITALAITALAGTWAVVSFACDHSKTTTASATTAAAAKGECPYAHGANVTAEVKGQCPYTHGANVTADAHGACSTSKSAAVAAGASSSCVTSTTSAMAASASGVCQHANGAAADHCAGMKASGATAVSEGCAISKASAAVYAGAGKVDAVATGGASCPHNHGASTMATRTGCAICDEYASCDERLAKAGAVTQVVPLKNGVMFVYTASVENQAHAVQAAVHRRNDRIAEIASTGGDVPLCDGCRAMRGAMASGKLHREVVNIEGGSLTLVTSEDPTVVKALQEYSGVQTVKS